MKEAIWIDVEINRTASLPALSISPGRQPVANWPRELVGGCDSWSMMLLAFVGIDSYRLSRQFKDVRRR